MKRIILISIFVSHTIIIMSQTFIQEDKAWNVVECINWSGCRTQTFKIMGDTTIGQREYKKLYATNDTTLSNWSKYGAIREDENKVYFYLFASETEVLLYDFDLNVGDNFISTHNSIEYQVCPIEMEVTSIDTVTIENGEQRQRFNFSDGEKWISGIGSLYGLIYVGVHQCVIDMYYDLSCCHENDELVFQSPNFDNCLINTVGLNENSTQLNNSVYPNPFTQSTVLNFDYSRSQTYKLQIINSAGQLVKKINQINCGKIEISGNQLNSGIYFYILTNDKNEIVSGKFIKKE
ncbi:MAG: T9SS type A sorting domain-containing protein [Bacteroidales bacterium]|nr:T9SS type A sorting domain-containing protein [Bacteroidales bacterium]